MEARKALITADMVINNVIKKHPATIGVFNKFNVDSCCGGAKRLNESLQGKELDQLVAALNQAAQEAS